MTDRTENDALIQHLTENYEPHKVSLARGDAHRADILAVPKGMELKSIKGFLDQYLPTPERRKGTTKLEDIDSFCAFVNRQKNPASVIFATPGEEPSLTCVFDHDPEGPEGAGWSQHRAVYAFPLSSQWVAWRKAHGVAVTQANFALFIEDRAVDLIARPDPAPVPCVAIDVADSMGLTLATPGEVMAASRGLRIRAELNIKEAVVTETGETEVSFVEKHEGERGEKLVVPTAFLIAIPVFRNEPLDVALVRLRYRRQEQRILWTPSLHAPDDILAEALKSAVERVRAATELPVFLGSAPAERA